MKRKVIENSPVTSKPTLLCGRFFLSKDVFSFAGNASPPPPARFLAEF
jgi:hypothetical protein